MASPWDDWLGDALEVLDWLKFRNAIPMTLRTLCDRAQAGNTALFVHGVSKAAPEVKSQPFVELDEIKIAVEVAFAHARTSYQLSNRGGLIYALTATFTQTFHP